jgi:ribonuclease HI
VIAKGYYKAWIDGASRGNPGEAAIGGYLQSPSGEMVFDFSRRIGVATNNVAEYSALEYLLTAIGNLSAAKGDVDGLVVHSDSQLLVRQMEGKYKVKNKDLISLFAKLRKLIDQLEFPVTFVHIERAENREADRLANQAFKDKQ